MNKSSAAITAQVKRSALDAGFDLVMVTSADEFQQDRQAALQRLEDGLMEGLPWYTESRVHRGSDPQQLLPGARSIISLGLSYFSSEEAVPPSHALGGRVARYALGRDYHRIMKSRMKSLVQTLSQDLESPVEARWYVDDGPMLDRAAASRSGLGWFGKNTNILTPGLGSWVFLGQIVTNLELVPDSPLLKSCGECTLCIEACPTGAIVQPYVLDNPRCISHLTIENRGPIPAQLRPMMGDWVFGCDICQDVCPVNRKAAPSHRPISPLPSPPANTGAGAPGGTGPERFMDLAAVLEMTRDEFQVNFRGSPVKRARWSGLLRNACVALGNSGDPRAVSILLHALEHPEALVRGHAAWALGGLGGSRTADRLKEALEFEEDSWVREEIKGALVALVRSRAGVED